MSNLPSQQNLNDSSGKEKPVPIKLPSKVTNHFEIKGKLLLIVFFLTIIPCFII